jgi:hypothetical protein
MNYHRDVGNVKNHPQQLNQWIMKKTETNQILFSAPHANSLNASGVTALSLAAAATDVTK